MKFSTQHTRLRPYQVMLHITDDFATGWFRSVFFPVEIEYDLIDISYLKAQQCLTHWTPT